jgi:aminoglycoside phosphotransferase family enzyme/predicted kinase
MTLVDDLKAQARELRETHISWVFLFDDLVFKVKKPVSLGFLDFLTLERRWAACRSEVTLNRRLAPDVYLGLAPVSKNDAGRYSLGPIMAEPSDGEASESLPETKATVVDWAVAMRRLPDEQRADMRLGTGQLALGDLEALATTLARFHEKADTSSQIEAYGSVGSIGINVRENFSQMRGLAGAMLSADEARRLESKQLGFLEDNRALFERRVLTHRIRDGHGDLRLEHVYFRWGAEPSILDCIEFNDRFRYADVCCDVAFLSMDLARCGRVDLAESFLFAYASESDDYDLFPLVDFYESYRAIVRAKVCAITLAQNTLDPSARSRLLEQGRRYCLLALAARPPATARPRVIAVGGIIASGKSTLAEALGRELPAPVLSSDRTRKALLAVEPTRRLQDPAWEGAYSAARTRSVYDELLRRAGVVLSSGRDIVLDASFRTRAARQKARELARELGAEFLFVECRAPLELCRQRLRERATGPSISDGRAEIFDEFANAYEPVLELDACEHVVLDTSGPVAESLARLKERRVLAI